MLIKSLPFSIGVFALVGFALISLMGARPDPDFDDVTSSFPEVALKDPSAKVPMAPPKETEEDVKQAIDEALNVAK